MMNQQVANIDWFDVVESFEDIHRKAIAGGIFFTIFSYVILWGYDLIACRYIAKPLPLSSIALSSFVGNAFANIFGFSLISGSSVKFRLYSSWGFDAADVTKIILFNTLTLWLGLLALAGPSLFYLVDAILKPIALLLSILPWMYVLLAGTRKEPLQLFGFQLPSPGFRLALQQLGISILDWLLVGSTLFVLLPKYMPPLDFYTSFFAAQLAGVLSQVPGGLGIFDTAFTLAWSDPADNDAILACLMAFRLIYYIVPLLLGGILLGIREAFVSRPFVGKLARASFSWGASLAPTLLTITTFIAGAVLLFSGATPEVDDRLNWLLQYIPLPILETSHFIGSVVGICLLFLARGIQRKVDAAYHLTVLLLGLGIISCLLKGLDYEEASILGCMLLAFLPNRKAFYRNTRLLSARFTPGWIVSIFLVVITTVWLLFFGFKHVEYSHDLWWTFTLDSQASRALRAEVGVVVAALVFGWWRLFRPVPYQPVAATQDRQKQILQIASHSSETRANLALLGDKEFLFSESHQGFLMFGVSGRNWISMGDPICSDNELESLVWTFREACDRHSCKTVFYEVKRENLHVYLDLGLSVLKLGEEAFVDLPTFSLDGASRKNMRNIRNTLEKQGCYLEVVPSQHFSDIAGDLQMVSDEWLAAKNTREKRFSLGRFDHAYLSNFPTAIIRREGKILAFANIWQTWTKEELSIDLMRFASSAPDGVMEYLLCSLMLWGRDQGYARFNLGMAPFSGLNRHALGPAWNRFGNFLYAHAEEYYNFKGLRRYKEKFNPIWEPRFLAAPGGIALPSVLASITSLISGGVRGVISK